MAEEPQLQGDLLHIRYVPLSQARLWDRNPKKHDSDQLIESIRRHGFRDAPIYDETLDAISAGNGRTTAVAAMRDAGEEPPAGIAVDEAGEWYVPMQFGVNAESIAAAEAFAVAHNNLTMAGGGFSFLDIAKMWEAEAYADMLHDLRAAGELPVGVTSNDIDQLLKQADAIVDEQDAGPVDYDAAWDVIVTCKSEAEQLDLLERLMGEGYECQALVS